MLSSEDRDRIPVAQKSATVPLGQVIVEHGLLDHTSVEEELERYHAGRDAG